MLKVSNILKDNAAFQAWFNGSKVVDKDGNPIPVYHGTDKKFQSFDLNKSTQGLIWFTSDKSAVEAREVGAQGHGYILELYACIRNPAGWKEYDQLGIGEIIGRGFDGVILPESDGTFTGIAFAPTQLKSVKNKGNWNPRDKRLTAALIKNLYKVQRDELGLYIKLGPGKILRRQKPAWNPDPFREGMTLRVTPSKFGEDFRLVKHPDYGSIHEVWKLTEQTGHSKLSPA